MVVQHNLTAMNANRMLGITTGQQAKSSEKLSSGYRINRAADDAAGLSISEKMRKQINGLDRASTNAQDGVSAVQTAEGALAEVHSMLQRMNELSVQAANGTNSLDDREAIQAEMHQLTTEIDRVAETTKFNETYLLKGTEGTKEIYMVGHDAGIAGRLSDGVDKATFTVEIPEIGEQISIGGKIYTIGATKEDAEGLLVAPENGSTTTFTIDGVEYVASTTGADTTIKNSNGDALYWDATNKVVTDTNGGGANAALTLDNLKTLITDGSEVSDGTTDYTVMIDREPAGDPNANPAVPAGDGVDEADNSIISKEKANQLIADELIKANQIGVDDPTEVQILSNVANDGKWTFEIQKATAEVPNRLSFMLHVGTEADMTNKIGVDIEAMTAAGLGVQNLNIADTTGIAATYAIDAIADALQKVSAQRSSLGAIQNRLEHTIANLDNVVENTTAAESRIRDTDMAEEMVEYSKNNILAQAGQSMLAQANQSTQGVLSLLQ